MLESSDVQLSVSESGGEPLLRASGKVVVRGMVWVWSDDKASASREEGIWRLDLSHLCRTLYFQPAEIEALAARLQASDPASPEQRASGNAA
ncbi:hypothetical protein D3C72_2059130 [compost metagenome]